MSFTDRITLSSSDYPGCTHIILTSPGERGRSFNGVLRVKNAVSQRFPKPLPPHLLQPFKTQLTATCPSPPPKGRVFPLSQPESEAMRQYIEEELAKGFIRPSTSPTSAGFFFVKKKDGGLRPCIDYRGLNDITVKFRYPLPLVPASLEQLRQAKFYTKLDLRNAYNLIRI